MSTSRQQLVLAQHPACDVVGCPEMASAHGGMRGLVLTVSTASQTAQVQVHFFTCARHGEWIAQASRAEGVPG